MQEITFNLGGFFGGPSPDPLDRLVLGNLQRTQKALQSHALRGERVTLRRDDTQRFTFEMPFFEVGSTTLQNARVLRTLLDSLTEIQRLDLRVHAVPALYQTRVYYDRTLWWEDATSAIKRGYADCKTLATWLAAQYLNAGVPARADFRWMPNQNGSRDFHILVLAPNGYEDPSKVKGMTGNETRQFVPNPVTG